MTALNTAGVLGAADLAAAALADVYACAAGRYAPVSITVTNRDAKATPLVRIAVSSQASAPLAAEWIEYDAPVVYGAPLVDTLTVGPGQKVYIQSDTANVSAVVNGTEWNIA